MKNLATTGLGGASNERREAEARKNRAAGLVLTDEGWRPAAEHERTRNQNNDELARLLNDLDLD